MTCANHPNRETFVRCGKCDKPICPDCMLIGPAGTRCRDCAAIRSSPLFQVSVDRLAIGIAVGLAVGLAGGYLLAAATAFGFFLLWIGLFYGGAVGESILRAIYRKRGTKVEVAAGLCTLAGALGGLAIYFASKGMSISFDLFMNFLTNHVFYAFAIGVAVFSAVSRTRFF